MGSVALRVEFSYFFGFFFFKYVFVALKKPCHLCVAACAAGSLTLG